MALVKEYKALKMREEIGEGIDGFLEQIVAAARIDPHSNLMRTIPSFREAILERLSSQGVVIKDRNTGVSHEGDWVKVYSVRSLIDGKVELFDGYGIKEETDGNNEMS